MLVTDIVTIYMHSVIVDTFIIGKRKTDCRSNTIAKLGEVAVKVVSRESKSCHQLNGRQTGVCCITEKTDEMYETGLSV